MNGSGSLPAGYRRLQLLSLIVGIVVLGASTAVAYRQPGMHQAYFRAYLFAWFFFLGLSLGSLGWMMMHHLMQANWSRAILRPAEAASINVVVMAVLFIPILLRLPELYPWAWPELVRHDNILIHKQPYLNAAAFAIRYVIYFAIWIAMTWALLAGSRSFDKTRSPATAARMRAISAAGIPIIIVTVTFAAIDWLMSRDPHWFSSDYGFIISVGQSFSGLLLAILVLVILAKRSPLKEMVTPQIYNDLGNLVLTLVILFAYLSFVQFLINWTGNVKSDVHWYAQHIAGVYGWIASLIIFFHFFFPFFLLLGKQNKRRPEVLTRIAVVLLIFRLVDIYWQVIPSRFAFPGQTAVDTGSSWLNLALPVGFAGIWLAVFLWRLNSHPLLAVAADETVSDSSQVDHGNASANPA